MKRLPPILAVLAATTLPASAHFGPAGHGSLMAGLSHPLTGLDHMLAMVTVGLWAALLGGRAVWLVPASFVATMMLGFVLAVAGVSVPFVEPVIAASIVVIALCAALALPVSASAAMAIVAAFALFHGAAHGTEIGASTHAPFAAGFALATALLHAIGLGIGLAAKRLLGSDQGKIAVRVAGAAAALSGLALAYAN